MYILKHNAYTEYCSNVLGPPQSFEMWDQRLQAQARTSVQVLDYCYWTRAIDVPLCLLILWGQLPTLCSRLWRMMYMVPCDGSHKLCTMATCSCARHGPASRNTSWHIWWIPKGQFCGAKVATQVQPHCQGPVSWTVKQEFAGSWRGGGALWESWCSGTFHVGWSRLCQADPGVRDSLWVIALNQCTPRGSSHFADQVPNRCALICQHCSAPWQPFPSHWQWTGSSRYRRCDGKWCGQISHAHPRCWGGSPCCIHSAEIGWSFSTNIKHNPPQQHHYLCEPSWSGQQRKQYTEIKHTTRHSAIPVPAITTLCIHGRLLQVWESERTT